MTEYVGPPSGGPTCSRLVRLSRTHVRDNSDASSEQHHRRRARAGGRGAVRDAAARRSRCAGDQDRAARRRRFRARLRHDGQGLVELFRLAQSIEGIADAGSEASRGPGCPGPAARSRGRVHPEPRAGCRRSVGRATAGSPRETSALDRVQCVGLRIVRAVRGEEGVRPPRPERSRSAVHHRHARRARKGGHLGRRHRRRHVRLLRDPDSALHAIDVGPGDDRRRVVVRLTRGVDGVRGLLHGLQWIGAAAQRGSSCIHRAVRPVSNGRRRGLPRHSERARVGSILRRCARPARADRRHAIQQQLRTRASSDRAPRRDPCRVRASSGLGRDPAARPRRHCQRAHEFGSGIHRPSTAVRTEPVAGHRFPGRDAACAAPAGADRRRRAAPGRRAGAWRTHRRHPGRDRHRPRDD